MKTCPKCNRSYDDETLNFCLDDGEWLIGDDVEGGESTRILPSPADASEAETRQNLRSTDETAVLPAATDPGRRTSRKTGLLVAAGALIVVALGLAIYKWVPFSNGTDPIGIPQLETEKLTGSGTVGQAAISPDGKFLAYVEIRSERLSLHVKQIETGSTVEILREGEFEDIDNLVFSPDGNFVYFGAVDKTKKISAYKVAALGGSPAAIPIPSSRFSLSPDGSKFAFYDDDAETTQTSISIANADGSGVRRLVTKSGKKFLEGTTAWAPEGDRILVVEGDDDRAPGPVNSLAIFSLKDNELKSLGSARWDRMGEAVWSPTGEFIYLLANKLAGPLRLWKVRASTGEAVEITKNERTFRDLSITSDGSKLVTTEVELRSGIWVSANLDPMKAVEVLPGRGDTWGLSWLPDGRIVYISDQSGAPEVWVMNADGSEQKQITNDRVAKSEPAVSPDGKTVAYSSPADGFQIFTVPVSGGSPTRIDTKLVGPENPAFSSDGKYLAFSAWADGRRSIFRMPLAGGGAERLTDYSATEPTYSPDGSLIACFYHAGNAKFMSLGIVPSDGGPPVKTFEIPLGSITARAPIWSPDGKQLTYVIAVNGNSDLWAQPVSGGDAIRLSQFSRPWMGRQAYSRDGKRIAVTRGERIIDAVMLKGLE